MVVVAHSVLSPMISILRCKIANLAAFQAVVVPVLAQADVMLSLTNTTVLFAPALVLRLVQLHADKGLSHARTVARIASKGKARCYFFDFAGASSSSPWGKDFNVTSRARAETFFSASVEYSVRVPRIT